MVSTGWMPRTSTCRSTARWTRPGRWATLTDEDVVFYNAGTWSLFFDGSAGGNGIGGTDLDAINIVGSTLYFSTDDNDVMPGTAGGW